jgi:RNA polymerase sigma-70 factor, ECF subfamily
MDRQVSGIVLREAGVLVCIVGAVEVHLGFPMQAAPTQATFFPSSVNSTVSVATLNRRNPMPIFKLSNTDLVVHCQQGDTPNRFAFAELVKRYQSHVERLLYHLAPDWNDRSDLVQEVWIRVYRHIQRLKEPEKFKGWLSRIVTNLFYDELRKRKRYRSPLSLDAPRQPDGDSSDWDLPCPAAGPDEILATQEFYNKLRSAIDQLPEAFRTTIVLRELQGLSYEEIADITAVSLGTVKSRIARARQRLQEQLQPYLEG